MAQAHASTSVYNDAGVLWDVPHGAGLIRRDQGVLDTPDSVKVSPQPFELENHFASFSPMAFGEALRSGNHRLLDQALLKDGNMLLRDCKLPTLSDTADRLCEVLTFSAGNGLPPKLFLTPRRNDDWYLADVAGLQLAERMLFAVQSHVSTLKNPNQEVVQAIATLTPEMFVYPVKAPGDRRFGFRSLVDYVSEDPFDGWMHTRAAFVRKFRQIWACRPGDPIVQVFIQNARQLSNLGERLPAVGEGQPDAIAISLGYGKFRNGHEKRPCLASFCFPNRVVVHCPIALLRDSVGSWTPLARKLLFAHDNANSVRLYASEAERATIAEMTSASFPHCNTTGVTTTTTQWLSVIPVLENVLLSVDEFRVDYGDDCTDISVEALVAAAWQLFSGQMLRCPIGSRHTPFGTVTMPVDDAWCLGASSPVPTDLPFVLELQGYRAQTILDLFIFACWNPIRSPVARPIVAVDHFRAIGDDGGTGFMPTHDMDLAGHRLSQRYPPKQLRQSALIFGERNQRPAPLNPRLSWLEDVVVTYLGKILYRLLATGSSVERQWCLSPFNRSPANGVEWCDWLTRMREAFKFSDTTLRVLWRLREIVPGVLTSTLASYLAAGNQASFKTLVVLLPRVFQYVNWFFLMLTRSDEPSMETMMSVCMRTLWRKLKFARQVTPGDGSPPRLAISLDLSQDGIFVTTDAPMSTLRWKLVAPLSRALLDYTQCFLEWVNYTRNQQLANIEYKPRPLPLLKAHVYTRATFLLWQGPPPYRHDEPELRLKRKLSDNEPRGIPRIDRAVYYGNVRAHLEAVGTGRLCDTTPLLDALEQSSRANVYGPLPLANIEDTAKHPLLRWQRPTIPWFRPPSEFGITHPGVPPRWVLDSNYWAFMNHGRGAWDTVAASEGVFYLLPLCAGTLSPLLACMHILRQAHAPSADFPARLVATVSAMAKVEWLDVVMGKAEIPRRCWLSALAVHYGIPTVMLYSENSTPPNAFSIYGHGTQTALHCQCAVVVVVGDDWYLHDIEFGQVRCVSPRGRCTGLVETHILDEANLPQDTLERIAANHSSISHYSRGQPRGATVEWTVWTLVCELNRIHYGWVAPPEDALLSTLATKACPLEKALRDLQVQGASPAEIRALNYFQALIMHVGLVGPRIARPEQPANIGAAPLGSPLCNVADETSRLAVLLVTDWCPRDLTSRSIERNMRIFQPYGECPLPSGVPAKSTLDRIVFGQQQAWDLRQQYFAMLLRAPACESDVPVRFGASVPYQLSRARPTLSFEDVWGMLRSVRDQVAPAELDQPSLAACPIPARFDVIHNADQWFQRLRTYGDANASPQEEIQSREARDPNPVRTWLNSYFDENATVEDVEGFRDARYSSAPNRLVDPFFDPHTRPVQRLESGVCTWDFGLVEPRALPGPDDPRRHILGPNESVDEGMSSAAASEAGPLEIALPMEIAAEGGASDAGVSADHVPVDWLQEVEAANRAEGAYRLRIVPLQPVCNQLAKEVSEHEIDETIRVTARTLLSHDYSKGTERLQALGFSDTAVWSSFGLVEPLEPEAYHVPEAGEGPFDNLGPIPARDEHVPPAAFVQPGGEVQVAPIRLPENSFPTCEQALRWFREHQAKYITFDTDLVLGIEDSIPYFYYNRAVEGRAIHVWRREAWQPMAQRYDNLTPSHVDELLGLFRQYITATVRGVDVRPFFNVEGEKLQLVNNVGIPVAGPLDDQPDHWLSNAFGEAELARLQAIARRRGHYDPGWVPRHPLRRPMGEWLRPEDTYAPGWERVHVQNVPLPLRPLYTEMLMSLSLDEFNYVPTVGRSLIHFLGEFGDEPDKTFEVPVPPSVFSDPAQVRPTLPIGHKYFSTGVNSSLARCILTWLTSWRNQWEILRVLVLSNEEWAEYRVRFPNSPATWTRWQDQLRHESPEQLRLRLRETQDVFTRFLLRAKILCATSKEASDLVLQSTLQTALGRWLDFRLNILRLLALDDSRGLVRPRVHAGKGTISIDRHHVYLFFSGDSPLGNFFHAQIPLMGDLHVPSSEHLYHVLQLIFSGDHDLIVPLLQHLDPADCKRQMTAWRRAGTIARWRVKQREWHDCGLDVATMNAVLRLKLATCPAYRDALANNPDTVFIEASPYDPFWGIRQGMTSRTLWTSVESWGANWLGRLHMAMAGQLARGAAQRQWPVLSLNELAMSILAKCKGAVRRPGPPRPLSTTLLSEIGRCSAVERYAPGAAPVTILTIPFVDGQDPRILTGQQVALGQRPIPQLAIIEREPNVSRGANKATRRMHRLRQARTK